MIIFHWRTTLDKSVAMATTLITVDCKLFQMMPYIIILKVRKFHQPTASRFCRAKKKPVGGHNVPPPPTLNRVNFGIVHLTQLSTDFKILVSKSKLGYAQSKIKEIIEIKQKTFVLLLIKRRYFFVTPGRYKYWFGRLKNRYFQPYHKQFKVQFLSRFHMAIQAGRQRLQPLH